MKTVLLVEDNRLNRELLRDWLEAYGYAVVEAVDGADALDKLHLGPPDLVLLDIRLPKLDGYGVLKAIRADARWQRLPVIAVTAFAMEGSREQGLQAGFDAYLTKPLDSQALQKVLQEHVPR